MNQFEDYAYYYNAFYKDKDYAGEAKDVDTILKKYSADVKNVIIYGCGTGSHDVELAKLGYKCHGIDLSSNMIREARKRSDELGLGIEYEVADIRKYEPHEKYDAVLSLFHVMSYQTGNDDIKNAFRAARRALNPGGLFLFDVWYGPGVLTDPPAVRVKEAEDDDNRLVRICRPDICDRTDIVDVNYEVMAVSKKSGVVRTIKETHRMRFFFFPEIEEYLRDTGFRLLDGLDCKTLSITDFSSWTCYFVAEAI